METLQSLALPFQLFLEFSIQAGSSGRTLDEIPGIGLVLRSRLENNNITHPAAKVLHRHDLEPRVSLTMNA